MAQATLVQARKRKNMDCDANADVGDLVFLSNLVPNKVEVAEDNNSPRPVFGIIISKSTSTKATILVDGIIKLAVIVNNGRLFISASGGLTLTAPTSNYLQQIGLSFGDGYIDFAPQARVKRS